jgi:hypothetical protein
MFIGRNECGLTFRDSLLYWRTLPGIRQAPRQFRGPGLTLGSVVLYARGVPPGTVVSETLSPLVLEPKQ